MLRVFRLIFRRRMMPLQKRDQETQDADHETYDNRDDGQGINALGYPLASQDQKCRNDKGKNSYQPKAHDDSQGPWKLLTLQRFLGWRSLLLKDHLTRISLETDT